MGFFCTHYVVLTNQEIFQNEYKVYRIYQTETENVSSSGNESILIYWTTYSQGRFANKQMFEANVPLTEKS